jgi:hypothetical protein
MPDFSKKSDISLETANTNSPKSCNNDECSVGFLNPFCKVRRYETIAFFDGFRWRRTLQLLLHDF